MPKIVERKDIIILSAELKCKSCTRSKERAHCPECGKIRLYGMTETVPAATPDGEIIVSNCKVYRCTGCAEKFNDVDWYFNCHATPKVDWKATKEEMRKRKQEEWMLRIEQGENFSYNMRVKCMAETGFDPITIRRLKTDLKRRPATASLSLQQQIDKLRKQIQDDMKEIGQDPESDQIYIDNVKMLTEKLHKLEEQAEAETK